MHQKKNSGLDWSELVRRRWLIVRNAVIAAALAVALSFVLPKKYVAVATLMPPAEQQGSGMSALLPELAMPGLNLARPASTAELFVEILKSRSVNERVLAREFRFDSDTLSLYRILHHPSVEVGLYGISERVGFAVSPQGIISIAVIMNDPQLAADVANAYVEELDRVNQEKSVSQAKNSRLYIERQLVETENKLADATQELARFQEKHKAVSLEEQTRASIDQAGELKGEIVAKQVELGVMQQTMRAKNPRVIQAQRELRELENRYRALQEGSSKTAETSDDVILPIADVPELAIQLAVLTRRVRIQETVWQLLNQQYYQVKINEARDTPTVQVLDRAVPPLFPSSPRKKVLVLVLTGLTALLTILFILGRSGLASLRESPEQYPRLLTLIDAVQQDIDRIKKK